MLIVPFQEPGAGEDALTRARAAVDALVSASAATEGDVGHAQDPVAAAALLELRARGRLRAVVTTVHHLASHDRGEVEDLQRRAVQEADACICASHWWAERIRDEFSVEPVVVPHGVERARFADVPASRDEAGAVFGWGPRPVVLALGGVQARKGSRVLLEAFARARVRIGDGALLVVAGPAEHAEYRDGWLEDAGRLGLVVARGRDPGPDVDVVELGAVPGGDMPMLLRACDALASPSTREGFGLASLEAAAAGLPVVVSDLPVFREHFTDGADCLMVPVGDSGPLAMALVRVLRDAALRATLVEGGTALARRFDWSRCASEHEDVYRRVLTAPAR